MPPPPARGHLYGARDLGCEHGTVSVRHPARGHRSGADRSTGWLWSTRTSPAYVVTTWWRKTGRVGGSQRLRSPMAHASSIRLPRRASAG